MPYPMPSIDLFYWALFIAFGIVPVVWIRSRQAWRQRKALRWQSTSAKIQFIELPQREKGTRVRISYSYFVGEYRSGEYNLFLEEALACEIARLLKDASVHVRYDTRNRNISTLTDEELFATANRALEKERQRELSSSPELRFDITRYKSDNERHTLN